MTSPAADAARMALRSDLDAILTLERRIRAAQAEQLRLVERAHALMHAVEGVHDGSSGSEREFGTRSFVAELATALTVPEGAAGALVADAGQQQTGRRIEHPLRMSTEGRPKPRRWVRRRRTQRGDRGDP